MVIDNGNGPPPAFKSKKIRTGNYYLIWNGLSKLTAEMFTRGNDGQLRCEGPLLVFHISHRDPDHHNFAQYILECTLSSESAKIRPLVVARILFRCHSTACLYSHMADDKFVAILMTFYDAVKAVLYFVDVHATLHELSPKPFDRWTGSQP